MCVPRQQPPFFNAGSSLNSSYSRFALLYSCKPSTPVVHTPFGPNCHWTSAQTSSMGWSLALYVWLAHISLMAGANVVDSAVIHR
jgi:hypothetical protein